MEQSFLPKIGWRMEQSASNGRSQDFEMLKKLRLLFNGSLESESQAKKRIKQKQRELAERLKQNRTYQQAVLNRTVDQLDLG
jgi:hypothetical protein